MGTGSKIRSRRGAADRADNSRGARRPGGGEGGRGKSESRAAGVDVGRAPSIYFACGATGAGKSHSVKARLAELQPARLVVVDPDAEYTDAGAITSSARELLARLQAPEYRVRFRPSHERTRAERQFAFVCQLVRWQLDPQPGQAAPAAAGPVVFVVDELADFVGPSFRESPDAWQWLIRRGRKYGLTLLAASQRPAMIDKTLFDLATTIRAHRLNNPASQRAIADALGVELSRVQALAGHAYIERNGYAGTVIEG